MLVTGLILLVVGGLVAYLGRGREQLLYIAGFVIFVVGIVLLILWAVDRSETETAMLTPLLALLAPTVVR